MTPSPDQEPLRIFLVAGESSGDALGAALMAGLKAEYTGPIEFSGVGGPMMTAEGLISLFPMADLAVMGLAEVLPRLRNLIRRIDETVKAAVNFKPDGVITIDSPDFSFRVGKRLKKAGVGPLVHYVAPTVWAWRPKRAKKVARFLDHLLCLFPFEPKYFLAEGLEATFVGHPVFQSKISEGDATSFRKDHDIPRDADILALLPGSRAGEISRLLPIFLETYELLRKKYSGLIAVLPAVPHLEQMVRDIVAKADIPVLVVSSQDEKEHAFAAARAALAASGTVSLELAVAGVPSVVAYRMHPLNAAIARRVIRVRYASIVNIIEGHPVIPEFLQDDCKALALASEIEALLFDPKSRADQQAGYEKALIKLGRDSGSGGVLAARAVLKTVNSWKTRPQRPEPE